MDNEKDEGKLLGKFTYDQYGEPIQTFELPVRKNKLNKTTKPLLENILRNGKSQSKFMNNSCRMCE